MPKVSEKRKFMKLYETFFIDDLLALETSGINDESQRRREEDIWEDYTLVMATLEQSRYGCRFVHHSIPKSMHFIESILPNLDENRFRQIARVSRSAFEYIFDIIKNDEVFNGKRSCKQFSVQTQLLIVLYRLGSSGEGGTFSKIASLFGVSDGGAIQNMTARVFGAILKHRKKYLYWPDCDERKILVGETLNELPHCIGYVDGTEIKLAEKPIGDPEAFFSRKHIYSLKVQAICDYKLRIRHIVLGYPGSVHDARIYNNCDLNTRTIEMLTGAEWIAGDSAYKLGSTLITPFRSSSTQGTEAQRNAFNRIFSRYRIRIEHCFGLMKERFGSLKELRIQIKNDSSIKLACRWILVCAVLHNILIQHKDDTFPIIERDVNNSTEDNEPENEIFVTNEGEAKRNSLLSLLLDINSFDTSL